MDNTQSIVMFQNYLTFWESLKLVCEKFLKLNFKSQFHPYKFQLVQQLNEDDNDRRLQFCKEMSKCLANNPNLFYNIYFFDKCFFSLNGMVNRHNWRYWSDSNPTLFREMRIQFSKKLNIWVEILGNHILLDHFSCQIILLAKYILIWWIIILTQ